MTSDKQRYAWFSKTELCELLDITQHWFDQNIKPHIPGDKIDKTSNAHMFYGRAIIEIWCVLRIKISRKAREASNGTPGTIDLIDIGGKSRATERLRHEQFRIARLERKELQKSLVSRQEVEDGLARLSAALREAGEQINKINPRCVEILNECIEKMEKIEVLPSKKS